MKRRTVEASHRVPHEEGVRVAHGASANKPANMMMAISIVPNAAEIETSNFHRSNNAGTKQQANEISSVKNHTTKKSLARS